jgi:hypothetical protein
LIFSFASLRNVALKFNPNGEHNRNLTVPQTCSLLQKFKDKVEARSDIKVVPLKIGDAYHLK